MSVDLGLSALQRDLEGLFRGFFSREASPAVARAAEPLGFDPDLWARLATTGAPGLAADGAGLTELVVVAEELGAAIAPVPLVDHLVATRAFPDAHLCSGSWVGAVALAPACDGVWPLVPAGAVAHVVVGVDGDELVAVRREPSGEALRNHAAAPLADCSVAGERTVLGPARAFERVRADWQVLTAAALVGVARAALGLGVDYAKTRLQFGVPIGAFQAVQHGLADLPGLVDGARLLVHKAAWAEGVGGDPGCIDPDRGDITDAQALSSMALLFAGDVAATVTDRSLHYHGGYGFAREYDIQLFYRRARGWALVSGSPSTETRRLADRLFGASGA